MKRLFMGVQFFVKGLSDVVIVVFGYVCDVAINTSNEFEQGIGRGIGEWGELLAEQLENHLLFGGLSVLTSLGDGLFEPIGEGDGNSF